MHQQGGRQLCLRLQLSLVCESRASYDSVNKYTVRWRGALLLILIPASLSVIFELEVSWEASYTLFYLASGLKGKELIRTMKMAPILAMISMVLDPMTHTLQDRGGGGGGGAAWGGGGGGVAPRISDVRHYYSKCYIKPPCTPSPKY